jgi:GGDEF domain-containing protein
MTRKKAKPARQAKVSRVPRPSLRARTGKRAAGDYDGRPQRPPSRAIVMRLAAEVDALAAQLQDSHARILELEARVDVDPLTDTLNRRGFERELKRSLAYVKRYGTSAALLRNVRASDVVARIGGDEFVVLLWNVGGSAAAAKAAALESAVYATPVRWGASTLAVGASAGVALLGPLDAPAAVLERADAAMYARKAERKGSPLPARGEKEQFTR